MATYIINGQEYECEYSLKDHSGSEKASFTNDAIKALDIQESMLNPFTRATIVIQNPFDYADNFMHTRGDGRDYFEIKLKHKDFDEELKYEFVIEGENNSISRGDRANNFKCYNLIDKNYFLLNESIPYGRRYRGKVGAIIKEIITEVIGEGVVGEWDDGDHEIGFYPEHLIPTTGYRWSDLIKYLCRVNYKKNKDVHERLYLMWNREEDKYNLQPLSKIFAKHTDLRIEGFGIGDLVGTGASSNPNNPIPEGKVDKGSGGMPQTDVNTPMLQYQNEYWQNALISGYDATLGVHQFRQLRVADMKKTWEELFVKVFTLKAGSPKPFLPLNKTKQEGVFKTFALPYTIDQQQGIVEAEMMANFTFYNLTLNFSILGNPRRMAGQFIDVFTLDPEDPVLSQEKVLGRWFVTKCRHKFTFDSYYNTFQCVKTYIGPGGDLGSDCVEWQG